ncbi:MAG: FAD-dependent oxidoreductase [Elusimicrobiota bacterium]|nr:FAD-dependent oxidoreductase [Elusimicrobiota bacterium]
MTGKKRKNNGPDGLPASAEVVILGAGLTGLVAARELARSGVKDILLLERDPRPGGLLKTNRSAGVTIDELPHVFFTKDKRASAIFREMVGPVYRYRHRLGVMWKGGYVDYPFQDNINQLDLEDRKTALRGLLEPRFERAPAEPRNLEEFSVRELGRGIVDLFFRPYNEKLWQTPLSGMGYKWLSAKIRLPGAAGLADSILGGLTAGRGEAAPHAEFIYPKRGGIESLAEGLLKSLKPLAPVCGAEVLKIDARRKIVATTRGEVRYGRLVSTLPLDRVIRLAGLKECCKPGSRLRATRVICLQYVLSRVNLPPYHWIYVPDPAVPFYRLTRVDLINPGSAPGGKALLVECALPPGAGNRAAAGLPSRVTASLVKLGVIKKKDIKKLWVYDHFPSYPVPHAGHAEDVPFCLRRLEAAGIVSAGRFGEWSIYNMDHSIEAGISAAEKILS